MSGWGGMRRLSASRRTGQRAGGRSPWWHRGVVYQVYPRSFADGNGDGVGDLPGLTGRLAYFAWLGIDAVWLSPIYRSPMKDFGYDIVDHKDVDPLFGSLADFDALVSKAHRLGLRLLVDYVPNHTSDQHPWFAEAGSSRRSTRRDWYLWRDGTADGGPPNNWRSVFGGSAWTRDPRSGQYYCHAYLPEQPDLNWRNGDVRAELLDVLRFWLDRGVDGFRADALRHLLKDPAWHDNPPNPDFHPGRPPYEALLPVNSTDLDDIHEPIAAMRRVLSEHGRPHEERLLIGELYVPIERLVRYYGKDGGGIQLSSNMHLIDTAWRPDAIAALIERYESALPAEAWPNWVLGNHDRSRIASRLGAAQARVAAMLLLTLRGTPTLYYGDELGMLDTPIEPERIRDPYQRRVPDLAVGRDPARTPMQWNAAVNAGFCPPEAEPWLPTADDFAQINVASESDDPHSMLVLQRRLLALRRRHDTLTVGDYHTAEAAAHVLAYVRESSKERTLVALNLSAEPQTLALRQSGTALISTYLDREGERLGCDVRLRPDEGIVAELDL
jgi:alpha-glucosidase